MESSNIVLIGLGHHAKRIYLDFKDTIKDAELIGIVDLESQRTNLERFLKEKNINVPILFLQNEDIGDKLNAKDQSLLDNFVKDLNCNAVIISTDPLAHLKYTLWALSRRLHILLDKPITSEINVSTKIAKARKLYKDYEKIESVYKSALKEKNVVFVLQAQRRFHSGFKYAKNKIIEIYEKTNCPVTSIQSFHSDGQWRLPDEIQDIKYHSYNQNYGKMSHSGYHSLDIAAWFCELSLGNDKRYSKFEVYSKFSRPFDFLNQIKPEDYPLFMKGFKNRNNADTYRKKLKIEGEIDAFNSISFLNSKGALITHLSSSMVHNGFSQRGWFDPNMQNLYKGNGRVRHESYIIEQGPFQCIIINSFQSHEVLKGDLDKEIGGENHFDVHIFRNSSLFDSVPPYELHQINETSSHGEMSYSRGHNEDARRRCIKEFVDSIREGRKPESQNSNFFEHKLSTKLLSAIYESAAKELKNKNSVIIKKI